MNQRFFIFLCAVAAMGAGCGTPGAEQAASPKSEAAASIPDSVPSSAPASSAPSTGDNPAAPPSTNAVAPAKTTNKTTRTATAPAPAPPSDTGGVPATLKHEGFEYSGVTYAKPLDMELTMSTQPGVTTGSQTVTLKESKDGKAVYTIDRSGGLAILGTEEWTITKDGVYTTKSSMMDVGQQAMELPANPKPGMTWKVHTKANQPNAKMDMEMTFKVIGKQSVSTKAGRFSDALVVEQDGVGTLQNQKVRTESQNWYVKGIGLVKATMKNHLPDGKTESLSIQETNAK